MKIIFTLLFITTIYVNANENLNEVESLLKITPNDSELYFRRAYIYCELERYSDAIDDLVKCTKLEPNDNIYHFYLAKTYMKIGQVRNAIVSFENSIRVCNGNNSESYFFLAELHRSVNEKSAAMDSFDKAIEENKNIAKYWAGRARLKSDTDIDEAIKDYNKAIEIEPNFTYAHYDLVWINIERKQFESALEHALLVFEADSLNPIFCDALACAYSEKDIKKAIEFERKAIDLGADADCKQKLEAFKNGNTYIEYKRNKEKIEKENEQIELAEKLRKERIWQEIVEKNKSVNKQKSNRSNK